MVKTTIPPRSIIIGEDGDEAVMTRGISPVLGAVAPRRMDPEATAQQVSLARHRGNTMTAHSLECRFFAQAQGDDIEDYRTALHYLNLYGVC